MREEGAMADQTIIMNVERASSPGFSGAQAYPGQAAIRSRETPQESARSKKTSALDESREEEKLGDAVRLVQDEHSGRSVVEILDKRTGEVMYQIPPEEVRKLAELLKDLTGSMVDKRV